MPPRHRPAGALREPYEALKRLAHSDLGGPDTSAQLLKLALASLRFLRDECITINLTSHVPNKKYFSYVKKSDPASPSRPINEDLFDVNESALTKQWIAYSGGKTQVETRAIARLSYTMAMVYCAAIDLFDRNNKKGPATYFECLVGHLFAHELGVNPTKKVSIPVSKGRVRMTMDFLFDPGQGRPRVHLPVKMSTRERVVQAWAHQRLLDASYGPGKFRGILVVFSETKLDLKTREVVEICVPDQWLAYQTLLARMDRIYYFDVPKRYADLSSEFPIINLKQFGQFFAEREAVLKAPVAVL